MWELHDRSERLRAASFKYTRGLTARARRNCLRSAAKGFVDPLGKSGRGAQLSAAMGPP